jgi:hypothetical protein
MKTKSVKFKRLLSTGGGRVLIIPNLWIEEMGWSTNTKLVLEYHAYKKEIVITEDYRGISPMKLPEEKEVEVE